jgi:hypothetical protein
MYGIFYLLKKITVALIITAKCEMSKEKTFDTTYSSVPKIFNGSFPAIFYMRGRKPRHFSSETGFCLLVTHLRKPLFHKASERL